MVTEEQKNNFQTLDEKKKIIKLERALTCLKKVGSHQVKLLKIHEKSDSPKEIGFAYFFKTLKHTWENIDFAIHLGKGRYRAFNVYPTRVILENVFRLEYYINQKKKGQNEICLWEMLRLMKRFYDYCGEAKFKDYYDGIIRDLGEKDIKYPNIIDKNAYKDPFPSIEKLIENSKLPNNNNFYIHYRFLCESHHSKLMSIYIAENEMIQYRRDLFYIFLFSRWLISLTDKHIQLATKEEVKEALKKTDEIVFS